MQIAAAGVAAPRFALATGRDSRRLRPAAAAVAGADEDGPREGDVFRLVPCYDLVRRAVRCVQILPEGRHGGTLWSLERLEEARRWVELGAVPRPLYHEYLPHSDCSDALVVQAVLMFSPGACTVLWWPKCNAQERCPERSSP